MKPDGSNTLLPPSFWYDGMDKIKAGKGYRKGVPLGRIGPPCDECKTPIIHISICVSSRGSEFITEKVCPNCGLVHGELHYDCNKEYIIQMNGSSKGVYRPNTQRKYGGSFKRLEKAKHRLNRTNASKKQPMKEWRNTEYHLIAEDYIHELGLNKPDARDVHYYIDHRGNTLNTRYKMDIIILHLCAVIGQTKHFYLDSRYIKKLYDLLRERYPR
jgi:hypothetical protein